MSEDGFFKDASPYVRNRQFICDSIDLSVFMIVNAIGMLSILDENYSFICMLIYVPVAFNISIYEICYMFKLLSVSKSKHILIYSLFSFYYGTNLLSSVIVGLILLQGFFNDNQNIIRF